MSKFVNNMHAAFERALRRSLRVHNRELLAGLIVLGVMLVASSVSAQTLPTSSSASRNTHDTPQSVLTATAPKPAQQEQAPQQAPSPSSPDRVQAKPLQVTYEAGQLTIIAENSKLSDILASLRECMGADIDLPASASTERMWARVGPGPARKVLATLLSQTKLDYVIQASDTDPDGIRNVWLTPRTEGPAVTTAKVGVPAARPLPPRLSDSERRVMPNRREETDSPDPTVSTDSPAAPTQPPPAAGTQPAPTDAPPASTQPAPAATDAPTASDTQGSEPSKPVNNATPAATPPANPTEQMIQTLQNMYEQRKQMNLARTPTTPN